MSSGKDQLKHITFSRQNWVFEKSKRNDDTKGGVWKFYTSNDLDNPEHLDNPQESDSLADLDYPEDSKN